MKKNILFLMVVLNALSLFAKEKLPVGLLPSEIEAYDKLISRRSQTVKDLANTPPVFKVRTPAEYEPMEAVAIQWSSREQDELHAFLVENIQLADADVIIIVDGNSGKDYITNYLNSNGISMARVHFITRSADSIWMRDYGPQTIYKFDGSKRAIVDWEYNRPRPADDVVPEVIAEFLGADLYKADENSGNNQLVFCGGNFMTDGFGKAFSSKLVQSENGGYNQQTIDRLASIMHNYHGIDTHVQMTELPYDGIHHIDMHLKLLDEETLLVGEYPSGISDGPQIEANLQYILDNFKTCYGTDYKIVRIPMPDDYNQYPDNHGDYLTHTNSLIVNNYVLVPLFNQSSDAENELALNVYRNAMPGYIVKGFDCTSIIARSGAIHCITHDINKDKVLRIEAPKVEEISEEDKDSFIFKVNIWPYEQNVDSCFFYLKNKSENDFTKFRMNSVDNDSNSFMYTPSFTATGDYEYYFKAYSSNIVGYKPQNAYAEGSYSVHISSFLDINENNAVPSRFVVGKPYPNPFNPTTSLEYFVDQDTEVSLKVFNSKGELMLNRNLNAFKGVNNLTINGNHLTSGIYFYQMKAKGFKGVRSGRMLLVK